MLGHLIPCNETFLGKKHNTEISKTSYCTAGHTKQVWCQINRRKIYIFIFRNGDVVLRGTLFPGLVEQQTMISTNVEV